MVKVKVCCISSLNEAEMAIEAGAHALGLVGAMPSGPGIIDDNLIFSISQQVPSHILTFLLTSNTTSISIIEHYSKVKTNTIQIVDEVSNDTYTYLRKALPQINLVQVIHVQDEASIDIAIEKSFFVDYILLDSGNPKAEVKTLGGTGKTHNWGISRKIVESVDKPVFLAGGLNPDNIRRALGEVNPYGVDLCSGIRTSGKLDERKLNLFINNAMKEA